MDIFPSHSAVYVYQAYLSTKKILVTVKKYSLISRFFLVSHGDCFKSSNKYLGS